MPRSTSLAVCAFAPDRIHLFARRSLSFAFCGAILFTGFSGRGLAQASAAATTTTLTSSPSTVALGTVVVFDAAVTSGGSAVTAGSVTFYDGTTAVNTAQVMSSSGSEPGHAIYRTRLGPGSHAVKAVFHATNAYLTSQSPATQITPTGVLATVTAISATGSASPYTLTGAVTAGGFTAAAGQVSFEDQSKGNALLGAATLGAGAQGFAAYTSYAGSANTANVVTADFNGDGLLDIAVTAYPSMVLLYLGNADGTFQSPIDSSAAANSFTPSGLAAGDVNGDGKLDLVVVDGYDNTVQVLLGDGTGGFALAASGPVGNSPTAVLLGDFNGDGILDIATSNLSDDTVSVLLGEGNGQFGAQIVSPTGTEPLNISAADLNGDGNLDLVTPDLGDGAVAVLLGEGDGTFQSPVNYATGNGPCFVAIGDLNNDGNLDLAVTNEDDGTISVLLGGAQGAFQPQTVLATPFGDKQVAIADFNGDGIPDLIAASDNLGSTASSNSVRVGKVTVLAGNGGGSFQAQQTFPAGDAGDSLAIGDFNGDGAPDAATTYGSGTSGLFDVLLHQVQATTSVAISVLVGATEHNIFAAFPGDSGHASSQSATIALEGAQLTTTLSLAVAPNPAVVGQQVGLTATLNPYSLGNLSAAGEMVTFQNGATVLGTAPLSSAGVATLLVSTLPQGTDSLTALYSGDTNFAKATSNTVSEVVNGATAVSLQFAAVKLVYPLPPVFAVSIAAKKNVAPTGTITLLDGTASVGSYPVPRISDGRLIGLVLPPLNVGQHSLTASYSGDANYAPGVSASVVVTITPGPVELALSCSSAKLQAGQPLSCTASAFELLLPASGALGYSLNGTAVGSVALKSGRASIVLSDPPAGNDVLTVTYAHQGNYQAAQPVSYRFSVAAR